MAGGSEPGGMIAAYAAKFDPAVEAAFRATYGIDTLTDPTLTPRRMRVLLSHLPLGALQGQDSEQAWSSETHMLATAVDALLVLNWNFMANFKALIHAITGQKLTSKDLPEFPTMVRRPGETADSTSEGGQAARVPTNPPAKASPAKTQTLQVSRDSAESTAESTADLASQVRRGQTVTVSGFAQLAQVLAGTGAVSVVSHGKPIGR